MSAAASEHRVRKRRVRETAMRSSSKFGADRWAPVLWNVMAATLDAIVIPRPEPTETAPQNLCEDKGYDFDECRRAATDRGYTPHIRSRGEEQRERKEHTDCQPRRWVVEVLH